MPLTAPRVDRSIHASKGQSATITEELIATADAGCFTLALTAELWRAGKRPRRAHMVAHVRSRNGRRLLDHEDRAQQPGRHSEHGRIEISAVRRLLGFQSAGAAFEHAHFPRRHPTIDLRFFRAASRHRSRRTRAAEQACAGILQARPPGLYGQVLATALSGRLKRDHRDRFEVCERGFERQKPSTGLHGVRGDPDVVRRDRLSFGAEGGSRSRLGPTLRTSPPIPRAEPAAAVRGNG